MVIGVRPQSDNSKGRNGLDNPWMSRVLGPDNPWTNCAHGLDIFRWKIFALELGNSNSELDTSLSKIFVLKLDGSK